MNRWLQAVLAGALFLLPCATVAAETLVPVATSPSGTILYMDRDSLRTSPHNGEYRRFPAVQVWGIYQIPGGRRSAARQERSLFSFNCRAQTMAILAYRNFLYGTRKLVDWQAADLDFKYQPVIPDTLTAQAMFFACSGGQVPIQPQEKTEAPDVLEEAD